MKRLLVVVLLSIPGVAHADESPEERAQAAMERGVAAFGRGESEIALTEYEAAMKLVPKANAPYLYAAEALVALARFPEAVADLEKYIAMKPDVSDADDVRKRIAKIKADHYPGHLSIVPNVDVVTVEVDGANGDRGRELDLPAGRHRIEVRAPDREPSVNDVQIVGDESGVLNVTLAPRKAAPPSTETRPTLWPTVGWITAGAGAVIFTTGIILDAAVLGPRIDDYRTAANRSDPAARDLHADATTLRGWTIATYVTGAVLAAGGVGILLFAPRTRTVEVTPWAGPTSAGLGLHGAF